MKTKTLVFQLIMAILVLGFVFGSSQPIADKPGFAQPGPGDPTPLSVGLDDLNGGSAKLNDWVTEYQDYYAIDNGKLELMIIKDGKISLLRGNDSEMGWIRTMEDWRYVNIYKINTFIQSNKVYSVTIDTHELIKNQKMKSDCSDIRISLRDPSEDSPEYLVPYQILECNSRGTIILFNSENVSGDDTYLKIYYGNPNAVDNQGDLISMISANGFYDDFEDGSIDPSKWSISKSTYNYRECSPSSTCQESNGALYLKSYLYTGDDGWCYAWTRADSTNLNIKSGECVALRLRMKNSYSFTRKVQLKLTDDSVLDELTSNQDTTNNYAICRSGNTYTVYKNGVKIKTLTSSASEIRFYTYNYMNTLNCHGCYSQSEMWLYYVTVPSVSVQLVSEKSPDIKIGHIDASYSVVQTTSTSLILRFINSENESQWFEYRIFKDMPFIWVRTSESTPFEMNIYPGGVNSSVTGDTLGVVTGTSFANFTEISLHKNDNVERQTSTNGFMSVYDTDVPEIMSVVWRNNKSVNINYTDRDTYETIALTNPPTEYFIYLQNTSNTNPYTYYKVMEDLYNFYSHNYSLSTSSTEMHQEVEVPFAIEGKAQEGVVAPINLPSDWRISTADVPWDGHNLVLTGSPSNVRVALEPDNVYIHSFDIGENATWPKVNHFYALEQWTNFTGPGTAKKTILSNGIMTKESNETDCLCVGDGNWCSRSSDTGYVSLTYPSAPVSAKLVLYPQNGEDPHSIYVNGQKIGTLSMFNSYNQCEKREYIEYNINPNVLVNGTNNITITNDADGTDDWSAIARLEVEYAPNVPTNSKLEYDIFIDGNCSGGIYLNVNGSWFTPQLTNKSREWIHISEDIPYNGTLNDVQMISNSSISGECKVWIKNLEIRNGGKRIFEVPTLPPRITENYQLINASSIIRNTWFYSNDHVDIQGYTSELEINSSNKVCQKFKADEKIPATEGKLKIYAYVDNQTNSPKVSFKIRDNNFNQVLSTGDEPVVTHNSIVSENLTLNTDINPGEEFWVCVEGYSNPAFSIKYRENSGISKYYNGSSWQSQNRSYAIWITYPGAGNTDVEVNARLQSNRTIYQATSIDDMNNINDWSPTRTDIEEINRSSPGAINSGYALNISWHDASSADVGAYKDVTIPKEAVEFAVWAKVPFKGTSVLYISLMDENGSEITGYNRTFDDFTPNEWTRIVINLNINEDVRRVQLGVRNANGVGSVFFDEPIFYTQTRRKGDKVKLSGNTNWEWIKVNDFVELGWIAKWWTAEDTKAQLPCIVEGSDQFCLLDELNGTRYFYIHQEYNSTTADTRELSGTDNITFPVQSLANDYQKLIDGKFSLDKDYLMMTRDGFRVAEWWDFDYEIDGNKTLGLIKFLNYPGEYTVKEWYPELNVTITVTPDVVYVNDTICANWTLNVDDPEVSEWEWKINGISVLNGTNHTDKTCISNTNASVSFSKHDNITFWIKPCVMKYGSRLCVDERNVTKQVINAPPTGQISVYPLSGQELKCEVNATDIDQDNITSQIHWLVDGTEKATDTGFESTFDISGYEGNYVISCQAGLSDGEDANTLVSTLNVSIARPKPYIEFDPDVNQTTVDNGVTAIIQLNDTRTNNETNWTLALDNGTIITSGTETGDVSNITLDLVGLAGDYWHKGATLVISTSECVNDNDLGKVCGSTIERNLTIVNSAPDGTINLTKDRFNAICSFEFTDADNDTIVYTGKWYVDGNESTSFNGTTQPNQEENSTLDLSSYTTQINVTCELNYTDGEVNKTLSETETFDLSRPVANVTISPLNVYTNTTVCGDWNFTDPLGGNDNSTWTWFVNGSIAREGIGKNDTCITGVFKKHDNITFSVTPCADDGRCGNPSNYTTTVLNTNPEINAVWINYTSRAPRSEATCNANATDIDNDSLSFEIHWYINGTYNSSYDGQTTISGDATDRTTVMCSARAWDGEGYSDWMNSTEVEFTELPNITNLSLTPENVTVMDVSLLHASWNFTDPENGTDISTVNWYIDGNYIATTQGVNGTSYFPSNITVYKHQNITAELNVTADRNGTIVVGDPIIVGTVEIKNSDVDVFNTTLYKIEDDKLGANFSVYDPDMGTAYSIVSFAVKLNNGTYNISTSDDCINITDPNERETCFVLSTLSYALEEAGESITTNVTMNVTISNVSDYTIEFNATFEYNFTSGNKITLYIIGKDTESTDSDTAELDYAEAIEEPIKPTPHTGGGGGGGGGGSSGGGAAASTSEEDKVVFNYTEEEITKETIEGDMTSEYGKVALEGINAINVEDRTSKLREGVTFTRTFGYVAKNGDIKESRYILKVRFDRPMDNIIIIEKIPKNFAESSNDITVNASKGKVKVLEKDPVYAWYIDSVETGEEVKLIFSVPKELGRYNVLIPMIKSEEKPLAFAYETPVEETGGANKTEEIINKTAPMPVTVGNKTIGNQTNATEKKPEVGWLTGLVGLNLDFSLIGWIAGVGAALFVIAALVLIAMAKMPGPGAKPGAPTVPSPEKEMPVITPPLRTSRGESKPEKKPKLEVTKPAPKPEPKPIVPVKKPVKPSTPARGVSELVEKPKKRSRSDMVNGLSDLLD